jgi:hypothetical protein
MIVRSRSLKSNTPRNRLAPIQSVLKFQEMNMKHDVKKSTTSMFGRVLVSVGVTAAGLLVGCSDKPPGCADLAVRQSVTETVVEQALEGGGNADSPWNAYIKRLNIELADVTTGGYDEGARLHKCQATLKLTDPRDTTSLTFQYSVQGIEGSRGEYRVAYYDTGYPTHLTIWGKAQSYLAYAADEKSKAATLAAQAETAALTIVAAPDPKPVVIQQARAEPAVATAALSAPTATPPASPEVSRVSPSSALQAAALPSTTAPSFNCTAKLSPTEQLICDTPVLARADTADPAVLKQRQRDWRRTRDACVDADCVQASYAKRTEELSR